MATNLTERVTFAVTPEMRQRAFQAAADLAVSPSTFYRMALGLCLARGIDYGAHVAEAEPPRKERDNGHQ